LYFSLRPLARLNILYLIMSDGTGRIASMHHNNPPDLLESIVDIHDDA
jgi:hypothetical protein